MSQPAPVPAPRSAGLIGIAASLAGIPYVYGGTSTSGFDCSGFTQYVFGKVGINLPRTAEDQRQASTSVSVPRVGDLVFFGSPAYHNGIYAGNGMMHDSPRTGLETALRAISKVDITVNQSDRLADRDQPMTAVRESFPSRSSGSGAPIEAGFWPAAGAIRAKNGG